MGHGNRTTLGSTCHTRAAPSCDMFNLGSSYFHVSLTTVRHLLNAQSHVTAFRPISEVARSWSDDNIKCQYSLLNISIHLFYLTSALREAHAAVFRSVGGGVEVLSPAGRHAAPMGGVRPKIGNCNNFFTKFSKYKRVEPAHPSHDFYEIFTDSLVSHVNCFVVNK